MKTIWMRWGLITALLSPLTVSAASMRCGSALVGEGDSAAMLKTRCGEPLFRDVWSPFVLAAGIQAPAEVWYYNFGPNQFLRIVRLQAGRIERIETDGYGFVDPPEPACDAGDLPEGLSKYRLLRACGEPQSRRVANVYVPYQGYNGFAHGRPGFVSVYREEWIYAIDERRVRIVTLENGRITDVRQTTGDYY